jgi:DNA polymerase I-like protein with 3'-5' exonuclease and polymerase domains
MDLHKLNRVMSGKFKEHVITHHINPTPDQAIEWLDTMQTGGLPIGFDIETMGGETACVGFANNAHEGMCINFRDWRTNRWTIEDEIRVRIRMQQLFNDRDVRFVAQNGMFDITWLWYKDKMRVHSVWFDTMLAHHTLYSQLPHGLAFLTAQYTDHPYYKDDGKNWREGGDINQFWEYNVKDCCITRASQMRMENELISFGQDRFFFDHVMRLQPHLARMTVGGLRVDAPFKEQLTVELTEQVEQLREEFNNHARLATHDPDLNVNPNSAKQLSQLFFRKLRLVGRGQTTDAANRKRMHDHPQTGKHARAMLQTLNKYATEKKFLGTYADMSIDPDGRVRCEYKQTGVQSAPGRLSSSQVMWGSGGNLQNWPERAHYMVTADTDYVLLYFDLSQAEARVVGWLANIEKWIEQFEKARFDGSFDCHIALASDMFGIPYEDIPTYDRDKDGNVTLRFVAKRCRHGLNYRMQAPRLADTTGLPLERAREAYNLYHNASPELALWWGDLESEIRKTRQLVSPKGRVLRIMERITDEAMEAMVAFKPQSTIGDHVCEAIYMCEDDKDWPVRARMCLNIHDALIALVHKDDVHQAAQVMKRHAEAPIMINGRPLIIPADFAVSTVQDGHHRWSSLKKVKHLDQLTDVMRQSA